MTSADAERVIDATYGLHRTWRKCACNLCPLLRELIHAISLGEAALALADAQATSLRIRLEKANEIIDVASRVGRQ